MADALNKIRLGVFDAETAAIFRPSMRPGSIDTATAIRGVPTERRPFHHAAARASSTGPCARVPTQKSGGSAKAAAGGGGGSDKVDIDETDGGSDDEFEGTILHSHNAVVNTVNRKRLEKIKSQPFTFHVSNASFLSTRVLEYRLLSPAVSHWI